MKSIISLQQVRDLVNAFHKDYVDTCNAIKKAATLGESGIALEIPVEVEHRLEADGFSCLAQESGLTWIYWGD